MGFDTEKTFYHGSREGNIHEFDPEQAYHSGIRGKIAGFLTKDPEVAGQYAMGTSKSGSNVLPLRTNVKNIFDPENPGHLAQVQKQLELMKKGMKKDFADTLLSKDNIRYWTDGLSNPQTGWTILENEFVIDAVKKAGFDSAYSMEKGTKNLAVFDPKNIRSVNAAFDPKKKKSANILAGLAGATTLGAAASDEDEENLKQQALEQLMRGY
jgi:hypothetical protein